MYICTEGGSRELVAIVAGQIFSFGFPNELSRCIDPRALDQLLKGVVVEHALSIFAGKLVGLLQFALRKQ